MQDFYGNEYIESRWYDWFFQWRPYQQSRKPAILRWLINTVNRLQSQGNSVRAEWGESGASDPTTSSDYVILWLTQIGHQQGISLTAYDYDVLCKNGRDPAEVVVVAAKGHKWVEDHTVDKPKKRQ